MAAADDRAGILFWLTSAVLRGEGKWDVLVALDLTGRAEFLTTCIQVQITLAQLISCSVMQRNLLIPDMCRTAP